MPQHLLNGTLVGASQPSATSTYFTDRSKKPPSGLDLLEHTWCIPEALPGQNATPAKEMKREGDEKQARQVSE